jgi:hypothetical protein
VLHGREDSESSRALEFIQSNLLRIGSVIPITFCLVVFFVVVVVVVFQ